MRARRNLALVAAVLVLATAIPAVPAGRGLETPRAIDNDNDPANATVCASEQSYNGNVDINDDPVDLYVVQAPVSGQVFNVSLYVPTYPQCKMRLAALDAESREIEESFIDSPWQSLSVQAVKSNTNYYFSVNIVSGIGDYTLFYTLETPTVIASTNSFADQPLERASDNPCDWYVFAMTDSTNNGLNNDVAEFTVQKTVGLTLDVTIIALWTELTYYTYNISLDHTSGDMITAAASYTGNYYLRLWARSGSGTYSVSMGVLQSSLNDNDNGGPTATKLNNTPLSSWVDQAYDHYDWYKVYLLAGETLDVNMTLNQHTHGMYALWLYHVLGGLYTLVANATNFDPILGWTDTVRIRKTVSMDNRYYLLPMAERGLEADGSVSSTPANASYTLTLTSPPDINHGPILTGPYTYVSIPEDTPTVIFNLNTALEDPDGDQMFFNVTGSGNLSVKIESDGGVRVTPAADWVGMETIKVSATDVNGKRSDFDVHVSVINKNDPPRVKVAINNLTLQEDHITTINIGEVFWDPDIPYGDSLFYWWTGNSSIPMSMDNDTKEVTLGPVHGFLGTREVIFWVRDTANLRTYHKVLVSINHTNHPPVFKGASRLDIEMPEDGLNQSFLARDFFYDEDTTYAKDVLTYTGVRSEHINCTVGTGLDGRIIIKPDPDWNGQETAYVVAEDTGGLNISLEVHVVVDPVNDPPYVATFSPDAEEFVINETENLTLSVEAGDIDTPLGQLTYQWFVDGIKVNSTAAMFTFLTDMESSRQLPYNITVEISDGEFTTAHTWSVPVRNKNTLPVVTITSLQDGQVVADGEMRLLRADAYDAEHDNLAYTWKDNGATIGNLRSMNWRFSPGWHNVSIYVYDGTDTTVVSIRIFSNSKPVIEIIEPGVETKAKTTDTIRFSARVYDPDGDPVTLEWREGSKVLSREANFTMKLGKGLHYIKINASDGRGFNETPEIVIKVEEPPQSGFIPGPETLMVATALAIVGAVAALRRRRTR